MQRTQQFFLQTGCAPRPGVDLQMPGTQAQRPDKCLSGCMSQKGLGVPNSQAS